MAKKPFAEIVADFNAKLKAEGKTIADLDAENEAKQKAIGQEYANDPELQKIWAEAEADQE